MFEFCRICLDPENVSQSELKFVRHLCYCKDGNLHRKCLEEWMEKSGQKRCNQCHCKYNVDFVPRNFWSYIWSAQDERVKLLQKALRFINILHITLLVMYTCLYIPMDSWLQIKTLLIIATLARSYFNLKALSNLVTDLIQNYRSWKRRSFNVIIKDSN